MCSSHKINREGVLFQRLVFFDNLISDRDKLLFVLCGKGGEIFGSVSADFREERCDGISPCVFVDDADVNDLGGNDDIQHFRRIFIAGQLVLQRDLIIYLVQPLIGIRTECFGNDRGTGDIGGGSCCTPAPASHPASESGLSRGKIPDRGTDSAFRWFLPRTWNIRC